MSKTSRLRTPFGSQRVDRSQSLLKSARRHFYTIVPLIRDILSCKKSLLVRFEILALFVNTMTTEDKNSRRNRDHFEQQIQMQLSQKSKVFSEYYLAFLKFTSNFQYFEKERSHILNISEIIHSERGG